jgi:type II secretory pathway component PulF
MATTMYLDLDEFALTEIKSDRTVPYRKNVKFKTTDVPKLLSSFANLFAIDIYPSEVFKELANSMPQYASIFYDMNEMVVEGNSIPDSLTLIPQLKKFNKMISLGFASGKFTETIKLLRQYFDTVSFVEKKVNAVLKQPSFYAAVAGLLVAGMITFLFPKFEAIFASMPNVQLPAVTEFMLGLSHKPLITWVSTFVIVGLFIKFQKKIYTNMPVLGKPVKNLYRSLDVFLLSSIMGLGLASGMRALEVVNMLKDMRYEDPTVKEGLEIMAQRLENGSTIQDSYNRKLPHELRIAFIAGETSGRMPELLQQIAEEKAEEIAIQTEAVSTSITNSSIIIIGLVVGAVVASLYLSILSFVGTIGSGGM